MGGETPNDGDDEHEMGYTKASRGPKRKEEPGKSLWRGAGVRWARHREQNNKGDGVVKAQEARGVRKTSSTMLGAVDFILRDVRSHHRVPSWEVDVMRFALWKGALRVSPGPKTPTGTGWDPVASYNSHGRSSGAP